LRKSKRLNTNGVIMRRRSFLILTAGTAAGFAQKEPVTLGFLGASHSHAQGKLEVVRSLPEWRVIGACERDTKVQEMLRKQGIALLSREQLLSHPEIQVIAVESAMREHAVDGLAVLSAGKHLHLEKAPSDNMASFQRIVESGREKRLLVQVGYMWRYNTAIVKALEAARQGWLGSVYLIRASISNQLAPARRLEWEEFPGGIMFELGCHLIDPMARLMGRPSKITPFLRTDGAFGDTLKDNTLSVLEWNNAIGIVHGATMQPGSARYRAFEIQGTNGCAIVNPIEPPALTMDLQKAAGPYAAGVQKVEVPAYRRYVDDLRELAAAVRGETKLRVTAEEDLMVHETLLRCCAIY